MKRALLTLVAAVTLSLTVMVLRPAPTLAAEGPTQVMVPCAYTPTGPIPIDIGGGINPNSIVISRVAGTDCSNSVLTLTKVGTTPDVYAGFDNTCTLQSASPKASVTVWGCGTGFTFGPWDLKVIDGGVTVQTIRINVVI